MFWELEGLTINAQRHGELLLLLTYRSVLNLDEQPHGLRFVLNRTRAMYISALLVTGIDRERQEDGRALSARRRA